MAEYIDRQAVIVRICEDRRPLGFAMLFEHLRGTPAADVAPVVHGRWVDFYGDHKTAECSECQQLFAVTFGFPAKPEYFAAFQDFYRYCPHCGARMDGGEEDG